MTAPTGTYVPVVSVEEARAQAEWLIAEQRWLGQRTANAVADAWLADVAQLEDRARWLLAESEHHHQVTAKKAATAVVDARVARASLETIRARVSHAARVGLLTHRGHWPQEVIDAAARRMYGWPEPFELEGAMRLKAIDVLDAAARALHRDHVHVAPHSAAHTVDIVDKSGLSADLDTWLAKNRAAQTNPEVF